MWLPGVLVGLMIIALIVYYAMVQMFGEREEEVDAGMSRWDELNQAEMQQLVEEFQEVAGHVNVMNISLEKAVRHLRTAADYLDQVWKDCKIASVVGSSAGITGGVMTVLGGVATAMTAGAAIPLLTAGTAFGVAGACTILGTSAVEALVNSAIIQEADGAVGSANRAIDGVRKRIRVLKAGKSAAQLLFLASLATKMLGENGHLLVTLSASVAARAGIKRVATVEASKVLVENASREAVSVGVNVGMSTEVGAKAAGKAGSEVASEAAGNVVTTEGSKAVGKAGAKGGAKVAGTIIIGVSAAFLVLDVMELTFTVRDIVKNEGSNAARCLREKANEYETILRNR